MTRQQAQARIDRLAGLLMVSAYGIVATYELVRKARNPARVIRWQRIALAWWAVTGVAVPVLTLAYKLHLAVAVVGSALSGLSPLYWGLLRWLLRREEARLRNAGADYAGSPNRW